MYLNTRLFRFLGLWVVLTLLICLANPTLARNISYGESSIVVKTTADDLVDNGNCTLREAIIAANTDAPVDSCPAGGGADTIILTGGVYILQIIGPGENDSRTGDLDIKAPLTLRGAQDSSTIIQGYSDGIDEVDRDRIFHILDSAGQVYFDHLTITGSRANETGSGIYNSSDLWLTNTSVVNNRMDEYFGYFGGGIFNEGSLNLNNAQVNNNRASRGGGLYNTGDISISHSSIDHNLGDMDNYGGGIYSEGNITIEYSTINWNFSASGGGIENRGYFVIHDSEINNNAGRFRSGAFNNLGIAVIDNVTVNNNSSGHLVGAIENEGSLTIRSSQINNNISYDGVGAIAQSGTLIIEDTEISGNQTQGNGGALMVSGDVTLRNVTIHHNNNGNTRIADGGAIYSSGNLTIENSTIDNNRSFNDGGGIYQYSGAISIQSTVISNNQAQRNGGGVAQRSGTLVLTDTGVKKNSVVENGGGIFAAGSIQLDQVEVSDNLSSLDGAGIYTTGESNITQTRIVFNSADDDGGGIYNTGPMQILRSQILGNWGWAMVNWQIGGGGIANTGNLSLQESTVSSNWTIFEGAGISNTGDLYINRSSFLYNVARDWAGGINHKDGSLNIVNSTFTGNRGDSGGSGIAIQGGTASLLNLTISQNLVPQHWPGVGGGGLAVVAGNVSLQNLIIAANEDYSGLPVGPTINCYLSTSATINNLGGNLVGITDGCNWPNNPGDLTGTLATPLDPLLQPLQGTFMLPMHGSPILDAAIAADCPIEDQRGMSRPQAAGCDIGAIEAVQVQPAIDIKPNAIINLIDRNSTGRVAVAIFSDPGFDAANQINLATLTFGRTGNENSLYRTGDKVFCAPQDSNGDGKTDLICNFVIAQTGFMCGDTAGILRAYGLDGELILGQDAVRITPCP